jgi:hypothetical protein
LLRSTVFATVFLTAVWVAPALQARYFGTNVSARNRAEARGEGRVILKDGELSWAMATEPVRTKAANPYVAGAPEGTAFTESVANGTVTVTIWDLPGDVPELDAVLRQYERTDRVPGGEQEIRSAKVGAERIPARVVTRAMDYGLPTGRWVSLIVAILPAASGHPPRLLMIASVRPPAAGTVDGLSPAEAESVAWDELNAVRASFQGS